MHDDGIISSTPHFEGLLDEISKRLKSMVDTTYYLCTNSCQACLSSGDASE